MKNGFRVKRKRSWNNEGAIEGLPLYLIILVVVTAVALGVIWVWLNNQPKILGKIDISPKTIKDKTTGPITIHAWTTDNHDLSGVVFTFTGCNAKGSGTTGSDGTFSVTLSPGPTLPADTDFGTIQVTATKDTTTLQTTLTVEST